MTETAQKKLTLSKSDRIKVWWRSTFLQGSWNYERMQNGGWAYSLIPALRKLYPEKKDLSLALKRHLEFFNTHPYLASPIIGVTLALEEDKANGADVDNTAPLALSSSKARVTPIIGGAKYGCVLKNSKCLFKARDKTFEKQERMIV